MIRTQKWEPDTHPGYELFTEWEYPALGQAGEAVFLGCVEARRNGVVVDNPKGVYTTILAENTLKNSALRDIAALLPPSMQKPVLDEDGDPTGEFTVKAKHMPQWDFGAVDGVVTFTVPGADDALITAIREALAKYGSAVVIG